MAAAESPERDPISPLTASSELLEEETDERDQDLDKYLHIEEESISALQEEKDIKISSPLRPNNNSDEDNNLSDAKSQDSDNDQMQDEPNLPIHNVEREERASDLNDEVSSVIRELDEHELDYDEEVPEEPTSLVQEDENEKLGVDDEEEKAEDSPTDKKDNKEEEGDNAEKQKEKKNEEDGEADEGEIDDEDLEEGEVKDPSDRKTRPRITCRFFMRGHCTWGMSCRYLHPGMNDKGNYSLITKQDAFSANGNPPVGTNPLVPSNPWAVPPTDELIHPPVPEPATESAWERGLRHAKEVMKKATIRKEQEPDFEEKRLNVSIGEEDRDFDKENDFTHDWNYRITREVRESGEVEFRETVNHGADPYADPFYDYEMERFWRGGQYENFRVQYTENEPYRYRERERERDRQRDRERDRDRDRERRQRERERERERDRDKERRRKEEWEKDRTKRDEKERQKDREKEKEKEKDKTKVKSPLLQNRPIDAAKKETTAVVSAVPNTATSDTAAPTATGNSKVKRADEWKDPWRRSKSPKKKLGVSASPGRGRRRRRPSGSSASGSNSSRSSSRSSSYSGSSHSRSSSYSSYSSRSSRNSSFSGSGSRSGSFSSSPSPSPSPSPHKGLPKNKGEPAPSAAKGEKQIVKKPAPPPPVATMTVKPLKTGVEVAKPTENRIGRPKEMTRKAPPRRRTVSGSISGSGSSYSGSSSRSRSGSRSLSRSSRSSSSSASASPSASWKSRSLSVSSVSTASSISSSSSSVRSADSEDMYADLAIHIPPASSNSPTRAQAKKEKREKPKKDEPRLNKEEKRMRDPPTLPPKPAPSKIAKIVTATKPTQPPLGTDKASRKRFEPSDKDRQASPPAKKPNLSPDRSMRDRKQISKPPSPKLERQRVPNPKQAPTLTDRKRPMSPQPKSSSKVTSIPGKGPEAPVAAAKPSKPSTLSRREELLKQLKAVEDAIARKRAKIPGKV
ncbi:hypothetical protein GDO86_008213 [Hymenochirus boettgeri]|uniref:C3H1-type domain-containing protein n=1 Tax=Hymenochirus boettgeri TaxID=247094 RepID=A0A8T2IWU4_9PIPI|nr:hypothetical protein GDO86_008213 [Hymenochirus boettgeri]